MTTALLILMSLFFASYTVILKIRIWAYEQQVTAIEDAVRWYIKQPGEWTDATHQFVQTLKLYLKGEC